MADVLGENVNKKKRALKRPVKGGLEISIRPTASSETGVERSNPSFPWPATPIRWACSRVQWLRYEIVEAQVFATPLLNGWGVERHSAIRDWLAESPPHSLLKVNAVRTEKLQRKRRTEACKSYVYRQRQLSSSGQ